jgi:hypothetical protein
MRDTREEMTESLSIRINFSRDGFVYYILGRQ